MPQLMPLYWIVSMFMLMYILMMLIDMYYYKGEDYVQIILNESSEDFKINNYMW